MPSSELVQIYSLCSGRHQVSYKNGYTAPPCEYLWKVGTEDGANNSWTISISTVNINEYKTDIQNVRLGLSYYIIIMNNRWTVTKRTL